MKSYRQMALEHWEEFLPKKVAALKAQGPHALLNEVHAANRLVQAEIRTRMKAGAREWEAEEAALPMFILLPPE